MMLSSEHVLIVVCNTAMYSHAGYQPDMECFEHTVNSLREDSSSYHVIILAAQTGMAESHMAWMVTA
jgi:hypothetical protein